MAVVVSDMPMAADGRPAITVGMRGTLAFELDVRGPTRDLHSGLFGGAVLNPAQALAELLAGLHDKSGRISIPGIYDDVQRLDSGARTQLRRDGPSDTDLARTAAVPQVWGEPGFSGYERTTTRPALTINGLRAGYQGVGVKGVIPARASAKVSVRLATGQQPARIAQLIRRELHRRCPAAVTLRIRWQSASRPFEFSGDPRLLRVAARACMHGFGKRPAILRSGGTIPVLARFEGAGIPTLLIGFARPDDGAHAPNERFHIDTFARAVRTSIFLLEGLARAPARVSARSPQKHMRIEV
jgi:acetylornithine deacetylase/succinyl-diaminopimelate desuccinylase-like protein